MSVELIICGAAYGRADVTGKIRSLRKDQKISVKASNEVFGDSWPGESKSLVVVYKYGNNKAQVKIVKENSTLDISPPSARSVFDRKDRLSLSLKAGLTVSRREESALKLNILGAAYGLAEVTSRAQSLVAADQSFDQKASNDVWGDGWPGNAKTLVVVYEYSDIFMIDIAVEGDKMHFIASPPLTIIGAAYGLKSVTEKARELTKNRSFKATADNATFGDGWPGTEKTLAMVYQYGEERPLVAVAKENKQLEFMYTRGDDFYGSTNPNTLTILGAAYGPKNVTDKVTSLVKGGSSLEVKASNDVFGDPWKGESKSLAVVYRYGRNAPETRIAQEGSSISVSVPNPQPYADLIETNNLLEDGDLFALVALNGLFISCDSSSRLAATSTTVGQGCRLTVRKDNSSTQFFKLESDNGKFVVVGSGSYLYATGTASEAQLFLLSVSTKGGLRLSTKEGVFIRLDSTDGDHLKADSIDYLSASTIFDIAMQAIHPMLLKQLQMDVEISECDKAWISFIWSLVGGFFLAIGLGPFIATGEAKPGLLNLIKSSPAAWKALMKFKDAILASKGNISAVITGGLGVISVLYKEGLLWTIFKMALKAGIWWIIAKAIAKIIQVVFLPETEVAELLASFTTWAIQTVQSGLGVGQACN